MAIGMFKLTQKQRKGLAKLFIILNLAQIIVGFGITGSSVYICIAISPVLITEKPQVNFAFVATSLCGTNVIFNWIIGMGMCKKCLKQSHKKSTSNLLLLWYLAGTNTVVALVIICHFARRNGKQIIKSMKSSINSGMGMYLSDLTWKEMIDTLQYSNECCGITSYEDWHNVNWLTKYQVDVNNEAVKNFRTSKEVLDLPVTPWSCCRIDFPMQCLHDPLQQEQYTHIWVDEPAIVKDSINTKGCLDGLKKPIVLVINLFIFCTSLIFIFHIAIFIISRILYTSSRNAVLLGDPEGLAPGWIFGRGDCGYSGGKTLAEVMGLSPRPSFLAPDKKAKIANFGNMLPGRFWRNRKDKNESLPPEPPSFELDETITNRTNAGGGFNFKRPFSGTKTKRGKSPKSSRGKSEPSVEEELTMLQQ